MKQLAPHLALFFLMVAIGHTESANALGLCGKKESVFFSCLTVKGRWINLCGDALGHLQYRYGGFGKIELLYPENTAQSINQFQFAHYARFQTDRIEVEFKNQGVSYAVFDYTEQNQRRAGVRVMKPDGHSSEVVCSSKIISQLIDLERILHCDADNALNGGECSER